MTSRRINKCMHNSAKVWIIIVVIPSQIVNYSIFFCNVWLYIMNYLLLCWWRKSTSMQNTIVTSNIGVYIVLYVLTRKANLGDLQCFMVLWCVVLGSRIVCLGWCYEMYKSKTDPHTHQNRHPPAWGNKIEILTTSCRGSSRQYLLQDGSKGRW